MREPRGEGLGLGQSEGCLRSPREGGRSPGGDWGAQSSVLGGRFQEERLVPQGHAR